METAIIINVDGKSIETTHHKLTGLQIKQLAGVPVGNLLYHLKKDGDRVQIGDAEEVHLHSGERFVTTPPVGGAS